MMQILSNILEEHKTCEVPCGFLMPFSCDCVKFFFFEGVFNARQALYELGMLFNCYVQDGSLCQVSRE